MEVVNLILNLLTLATVGFTIYSLFVMNKNVLEMKKAFEETNLIFRTSLEADRNVRVTQTKILDGLAKKVRNLLDQ